MRRARRSRGYDAAMVRALASLTFVVLALPALVRADAPRVHLQVAADADESRALADVIRELVQRLPAELVLDPSVDDELVDPAARYVARITIDMRVADYALLFVHDPASDRVLIKRVERRGNPELVREEIGHIVQSAVEALLAGQTLGVPREEALQALREHGPPAAEGEPPAPATPVEGDKRTPPAPQPEPASTTRSHGAERAFEVSGGPFYEVAALGHEPGVVHGPGLALALRAPLGLGALLSAQYRLPLEVDADPIGLRSEALALRALAAFHVALSARAALRFGLGAGADIARLTPELAASGDARTTEPRTLALAVARALVAIDLRVTPFLSAWLALAADLDLDRSQYVLVDAGGEEHTVAEPWRVRPALAIGAALP